MMCTFKICIFLFVINRHKQHLILPLANNKLSEMLTVRTDIKLCTLSSVVKVICVWMHCKFMSQMCKVGCYWFRYQFWTQDMNNWSWVKSYNSVMINMFVDVIVWPKYDYLISLFFGVNLVLEEKNIGMIKSIFVNSVNTSLSLNKTLWF